MDKMESVFPSHWDSETAFPRRVRPSGGPVGFPSPKGVKELHDSGFPPLKMSLHAHGTVLVLIVD